ncbi:hypothetical protein [Microbispora sp. KK1-11]|uniref:hypothetical protein n=1 Tax=Microbispora sp. KK1-11 TaxID=2053005 RepID=UPI001157F318|nr:hypothetical protein [Microbispora sp. KK1-11]TQS29387.1 hypothetical protein FLW16_10350 [Microbispora sp. KK1-11]
MRDKAARITWEMGNSRKLSNAGGPPAASLSVERLRFAAQEIAARVTDELADERERREADRGIRMIGKEEPTTADDLAAAMEAARTASAGDTGALAHMTRHADPEVLRTSLAERRAEATRAAKRLRTTDHRSIRRRPRSSAARPALPLVYWSARAGWWRPGGLVEAGRGHSSRSERI